MTGCDANPPGPPARVAAILAGGLGTRFRSVREDIPKVLAPVAGRPFLTHLLDQVAGAGCERVILLTGYRAEMVRDVVGARWRGLEVLYSREQSPRDTGGALRLAWPLLEGETVLVLNGDSYLADDPRRFLDWFAARRFKAALAAVSLADTSRYGRLRLRQDDVVEAFEEKLPGAGWVNAGMYLFTPAALQAIPEDRPVSLEREVFPSLAGGALGAFRSSGRFLDIGTPESYRQAERFFAEARQSGHVAAP